MKISYFIAKRYLFSKRKLNFISVITAISVTGVTIGVAALIIVLSVFNGFQLRVFATLVGFDPHIRIESDTNLNEEEVNHITEILKQEGIKNHAPYTLNKAMLSSETANKVMYIKGVEEEEIDKVSGVREVIKIGKFNLKDEIDFGGIVLGLILADQMRTIQGDTLTLLSPVGLESALTQFVQPLTKEFKINGIYESENRDYDSKYAYISIKNAQYLFNLGNKISGIEIRLDDINNSDRVKEKLEKALGEKYTILTWYDLHQDFYSIIKIERLAAFIILSLIIVVASFNILGSLTMTVLEKKRDIGILRAMGATKQEITRIFLFEGVIVGIIGMFFGTLTGLAVTLIQKEYAIYKVISGSQQIALPIAYRATDFIFIPLAALLLCTIAALYPTYRASKLNPVESIRWE
ncbi:MAG: ABC transporter permease [Ignavibacteria bacterium]|nr:ABC transporter permease [Ignavibacteria bacterium]